MLVFDDISDVSSNRFVFHYTQHSVQLTCSDCLHVRLLRFSDMIRLKWVDQQQSNSTDNQLTSQLTHHGFDFGRLRFSLFDPVLKTRRWGQGNWAPKQRNNT